jgi:hypothetical protein
MSARTRILSVEAKAGGHERGRQRQVAGQQARLGTFESDLVPIVA